MSRKRPNILWYCTDQQRWDTIQALGNPHIRTPHLDGFCKRGVAFEQAYAMVATSGAGPERVAMY
jgi:arylsulfatase